MSLLLSNASIINVRDGSVTQSNVLIEDGKISKIGDIATAEKTIDINGKFLLPGLIDCHVHVYAIAANLNTLRFTPPTYVTPRAMQLMEAMLMRGFTTVRDAAGADWGIAKAVEEGFITSPRIIFGGPALSPTGGHGDSRSESDFTEHNCQGTHLSMICDGVAEVRRAARHLIRSGAHHIKIMASGGVASPTDRIDSLQFSEEEVRAIVEEANNANIYVLAHAYTAEAVNRALKLGVRCIEHANLLDQESVHLFLEHDAFLVPTLITYYALKEQGRELGLPEDSYNKVDSVLQTGKDAITKAYAGGVKMAYGTDLLGEMQTRQLEEFALLAELMKPLDILHTATINAAELIGMEGKVGEIVEGAYADLLVSDVNPLDDIGSLQDPGNLKIIMKEGQIYKNTL